MSDGFKMTQPVSTKVGSLQDDALWLGWESTDTPPFGFGRISTPARRRRLIRFQKDSHLITFGTTGSGKGTSAIVPNLLQYPGACVVLDLKNGELTRITARRRRELGQNVVVIDPFRLTDEPAGGLNPFSIFDLTDAQLEADSEVLAETCSRGLGRSKDPFWDQSGTALLSGVIACMATRPVAERSFRQLADLIQGDDTTYALALLLDTMKDKLPRMACREIAAFLQMPEITRGGVLATTQSYLKNLHSTGILDVLDRTTFALEDLVAGKPMTIYLVMPVDRIQSHRSLIKLLIGVILKCIVSRRSSPENRTLLLIDECAQLETFPFLETFITLCRAFGCRVWTFWQELSQLQTCYPTSWKTILNNCGVIQTFGIHNRDLAEQWSGYFDSPPDVLRGLKRHEQVLLIPNRGEVRSRRLNYLTDRQFVGLFDDNPLYLQCPTAASQPQPERELPTTPASTRAGRRTSGRGGPPSGGPDRLPR